MEKIAAMGAAVYEPRGFTAMNQYPCIDTFCFLRCNFVLQCDTDIGSPFSYLVLPLYSRAEHLSSRQLVLSLLVTPPLRGCRLDIGCDCACDCDPLHEPWYVDESYTSSTCLRKCISDRSPLLACWGCPNRGPSSGL
jgi:hypothetical protein